MANGAVAFRFVTTEYSLYRDVPEKRRFVFVSDLHDCPNDPVLEAIENAAPDAVLVGGDFVHNSQIYESGIEFLRRVSERFVTFVSLGNHEYKSGLDIRSMMRRTNARLLDDDFVRFGGILIGGASSGSRVDQHHGVPNADWLQKFAGTDGFKLLLCHHPEYYDRFIKPLAIDLTLAGHAHGGQWRIFGRGIFSPGQGVFPKYTSGLYDDRLIVCRGLGNPIIVPRIFNSRQIVLLNLIPTSKQTNAE